MNTGSSFSFRVCPAPSSSQAARTFRGIAYELQGDVSVLESLDPLAYDSLFSDPYFPEEVIPEESRGLAVKISQLLSQWNSCENRS
ncbi:hypothetical protein RRF57_000801 [Xylaria bambusicola]|uniref:Uncharacterized protein n=1 Tax=Xylaria bambusicola TaxID=326684 RepID=A0AAN7YUG6_9PEZI